MYRHLLTASGIISVAVYLLWDKIGLCEEDSYLFFQIGNALIIFLMCIFIWLNHKKLWISFFLLCASCNNLLDELFFDNTKLGLNEVIFAVILIIVTYIRYAGKATPPNR